MRCACAMPRAKKDQQKVPILKKTTVLCPSRSYYSMGCIYRHVGNWYYLQGIHVLVVSAYKWSCDTVSIKNSREGRYAIRGSSSYNWCWVDRLPLCWRTMSRIRACVSPTTYKIRKKWIFKENSSFFWLRQKIDWGVLPALYNLLVGENFYFSTENK